MESEPAMAKKSWIAKAVRPGHEGEFAAKAKAAGKSTAQYAREKEHAAGKLGQQARFALNAMKAAKKGRSHSSKLESRYGK